MNKTKVTLLTIAVLMLAGAAQASIDPNLATEILIDQNFDDTVLFVEGVHLTDEPDGIGDSSTTVGYWHSGGISDFGTAPSTLESWSATQSMVGFRNGFGDGQMTGYIDLGAGQGLFVASWRSLLTNTAFVYYARAGSKNYVDWSLDCGVYLAGNTIGVYDTAGGAPPETLVDTGVKVDDLLGGDPSDTAWHGYMLVVDLDGGLNLDPPDADKATYDVWFSRDGTDPDLTLIYEGAEFTKDVDQVFNSIKFGSMNDAVNYIYYDDVVLRNETGGYTGPYVCGDPGTEYAPLDWNLDCYVNLPDLVVFAAEWLFCTDPANSACDENWGQE